MRRLGAAPVIDYRAERFESLVRGVDLVLDTVGAEVLRRSIGVVRPGGRLVTLRHRDAIDESLHDADARGVALVPVTVVSSGELLTVLIAQVAAGMLAAHVDRDVSFDDAPAALAAFETAHVRGEWVVRVRRGA